MAVNTSVTVSGLLAQKWDKMFLEIATPMLKHEQLCTPKKVENNVGKVVNYTRYVMPANSATLTEGALPTAGTTSVVTVTATIAEEGYYEQVSTLLTFTGLDDGMTQRAVVLGKHAGNTLDQRARDEMFNGATVYLANAKAGITNITTADKLDAPNVRKAVRLLKSAFAPQRSTGRYAAVISEYAEFDLISDATWVAAKQYSDVNDLYNSYIGTFLDVDFVTSNQGKFEVSTIPQVWSNFFLGDEAVAKVDLNGLAKPTMFVKTSDNNDTSQPINTYITVGWKSYVTYKTLNPAYMVNVKTGSLG